MDGALARLKEALRGVESIIDDMEPDAKFTLTNQVLRRRLELTSGATTVLLSGFFEEFLKDLAKAASRDFGACGQPFASMAKKTRDAHFGQGGYILMSVQRALSKPGAVRHKWGTASADDVARRMLSPAAAATIADRQAMDIAAADASAAAAAAAAVPPTPPPPPTPLPPHPPYELLWEAFLDLKENPNSEVISTYLNRFGIENAWPLLAKFSPDPAWTEVQMSSVLNDLNSKRNDCAHTGAVPLPPDIPQMRQYVSMLRALSAAIVLVLSEHVRKLVGGCGPEMSP